MQLRKSTKESFRFSARNVNSMISSTGPAPTIVTYIRPSEMKSRIKMFKESLDTLDVFHEAVIKAAKKAELAGEFSAASLVNSYEKIPELKAKIIESLKLIKSDNLTPLHAPVKEYDKESKKITCKLNGLKAFIKEPSITIETLDDKTKLVILSRMARGDSEEDLLDLDIDLLY